MTVAPLQRAVLLAASLLVVAAVGGACSGGDDLAGRIAAAVAEGAGAVVHITPFRRYHGDFVGPLPSGGYTPEMAVFAAREEAGGFARWVVRAAVDRSGSGG